MRTAVILMMLLAFMAALVSASTGSREQLDKLTSDLTEAEKAKVKDITHPKDEPRVPKAEGAPDVPKPEKTKEPEASEVPKPEKTKEPKEDEMTSEAPMAVPTADVNGTVVNGTVPAAPSASTSPQAESGATSMGGSLLAIVFAVFGYMA
jgi:outer membrane biosynthesis protein TonB